MFGRHVKSIFASKTFWFNVLTATTAVAGAGVIPSNVSVPVITIGNIVLRYLSSEPVRILPEK